MTHGNRESVHTIPVPRGWSPEQAWEAIARGDTINARRLLWANVLIRDGAYVGVLSVGCGDGSRGA